MPWFRIFAEGVAIVVSILLAFAIQAWWDGVQKSDVEREALQGIATDFRANLGALESVITTHRAYRADLERLEAMSDSEIATVPSDSVDVYVRAMSGWMTFAPQDGTLRSLIASGDLELISDARLRDMLVEWTMRVEDLTEDAENVVSEGRRVVQRMGQLGGPWRIGSASAVLESRLADEMAHYRAADLSIAANDPELMARARTKRFLATIYLMELEDVADHADSVLSLLGVDHN